MIPCFQDLWILLSVINQSTSTLHQWNRGCKNFFANSGLEQKLVLVTTKNDFLKKKLYAHQTIIKQELYRGWGSKKINTAKPTYRKSCSDQQYKVKEVCRWILQQENIYKMQRANIKNKIKYIYILQLQRDQMMSKTCECCITEKKTRHRCVLC